MEEVIPKEGANHPELRNFSSHESKLPLISLVISGMLLFGFLLGMFGIYLGNRFFSSILLIVSYHLFFPIIFLAFAVFTLISSMKENDFLGKRFSIISIAIIIIYIVLFIIFNLLPYIRYSPGISS